MFKRGAGVCGGSPRNAGGGLTGVGRPAVSRSPEGGFDGVGNPASCLGELEVDVVGSPDRSGGVLRGVAGFVNANVLNLALASADAGTDEEAETFREGWLPLALPGFFRAKLCLDWLI